MTCDACAAARECHAGGGIWRWFDNRKCVYCAARLIQAIKSRPIGTTEATARCRAALADSVEAGLDEQEIRKLQAEKAIAFAPKEKK